MKKEKIRLWVDGQCLQTASRMRGIGRYVQDFLAEIAENRQDVDLHVSLNAAMSDEAVSARDFLQKWISPERIHLWHGVVEGAEQVYGYSERRKLSEIALCYHVADIEPDVALSASPFEDNGAVPLAPIVPLNIPIASIFYDAIPLRFPDKYLTDTMTESYYNRRFSFYSKFDINLCISDFARNELIDLVGDNKSQNIGAGVSKEFLELLEKNDIGQRDLNTLLYVGGFDWRKNVPSVIDAIAMLNNPLRNKIKFVVVGDLGTTMESQLKHKWNTVGLPKENLYLVGHVSDRALVRFYQRASVVIQPSLMEGFGLTALEAILCDVPVIASKAGALPEIVVDKGRLFDPSNTSDIAQHIQRVFDEIADGKNISAEVKEHARSFTWQRTVSIALKVLKGVARSKPEQNVSSYKMLLEQQIVSKLKMLKLSDDLKAGCLSRSQMPADGNPRLIIDVTSTVISNGGTGIQRVVTKICEQIANNTDDQISAVMAFSNTEDGWYSIPERTLNIRPTDITEKEYKISLNRNDNILMLDSSWPYFAQHSVSLKKARLLGCQVTSCLYDLVPLKASGFTRAGTPEIFSQWFRAALAYSTGFVCISKAVADELIALLHAIDFPKPLKIGFWPLGADFSDASIPSEHGEKLHEQRPSFLLVGTLEPRKGHKVALDAFDELWRRGADVQLIIVGKLGWNASHLVGRMQSHPEWNRRLFWNSAATDSELRTYYEASDCLVSTSFAEGFGLPIVEAGYFGKPIIASDIPVFREVSSKSHYSLFFELGNAVALADTVEKFLNERRGATANTQSVQRWANWAESATALKKVVLNNDWYHVYQPREARYLANIAEVVNIRMTRPLEPHELQFELSFADGPLSAEADDEVRYIIKITNRSKVTWTSLGSPSGENAVNLAPRLFDRHGDLIGEGRRSSIPFVIVPHDTVYMSIEIPVSWAKHPGAKIHIELVQEGVAWWGSPVVISVETLN
ncbi:glycosyltransferase family 4 protein [Brucella sp. 6810]|uniref:glycosyltransferase family 4 protein n=1 Tax=Brucella sp. 6810 TaxID=2769351 RepID=UPI00165C3AC0|nr:glycosyltransferase family 1 protein [Brucella sp. 6810]QNQ62038.1 glycosyltransferase family 4 protein [Brucella sp. 6810]